MPTIRCLVNSRFTESALPIFTYLGFLLVALIIQAYSLDPMIEETQLSAGASVSTIFSEGEAKGFVAYLHYAKAILQPSPIQLFTSLLWPPGFPGVIAAIIAVTGESAIAWKLMILSAIVWSCVLFSLHQLLPGLGSYVFRFLVLNIIWLFPSMREQCLLKGTLLSESLALAMFAFGWLTLVKATRLRNGWHLIYPLGWMLAAVYFRAAFDITLIAILAILGLFVLGNVLCRNQIVKPPRFSEFMGRNGFINGKHWATLVILYLAVTAPWKLHVWKASHHYAMSVTPYYIASRFSWSGTEEWMHGVTLPCRLDPDLCRSIQGGRPPRSPEEKLWAVQRTLRNHPIRWITEKSKEVGWLWFDKPFSQMQWQDWPRLLDGITLLFVGFFGIGVAFVWPDYRTRTPVERFEITFLSLMALVLTAQSLFLYLVFHFEFRFSMPLKLLFLLYAATVFSMRKSERSFVSQHGAVKSSLPSGAS